jgi:hypothetical protein
MLRSEQALIHVVKRVSYTRIKRIAVPQLLPSTKEENE